MRWRNKVRKHNIKESNTKIQLSKYKKKLVSVANKNNSYDEYLPKQTIQYESGKLERRKYAGD